MPALSGSTKIKHLKASVKCMLRTAIREGNQEYNFIIKIAIKLKEIRGKDLEIYLQATAMKCRFKLKFTNTGFKNIVTRHHKYKN